MQVPRQHLRSPRGGRLLFSSRPRHQVTPIEHLNPFSEQRSTAKADKEHSFFQPNADGRREIKTIVQCYKSLTSPDTDPDPDPESRDLRLAWVDRRHLPARAAESPGTSLMVVPRAAIFKLQKNVSEIFNNVGGELGIVP